jgi:multimeric flavodoxin WrbA
MTKILGVVGSPRRKGNTDILVSRVLEGAKSKGAETETLYLGRLNIRECNGCHLCWEGRECGKNDDMIEIYPKIIASDVMILGTPVYWYAPSALMKAFIDRFVYFNCPENRLKVRGMKAVTAIPFEENTPETADLLAKFFELSLSFLEIELIDQLIVPGVSAKGDVLAKEDVLQSAYNLGVSLVGR